MINIENEWYIGVKMKVKQRVHGTVYTKLTLFGTKYCVPVWSLKSRIYDELAKPINKETKEELLKLKDDVKRYRRNTYVFLVGL